MTVAGLPGRAAESILQLLQVFFVATVALIPRRALTILGGEILGFTGLKTSRTLRSRLRRRSYQAESALNLV
jgi:hypothetical protein